MVTALAHQVAGHATELASGDEHAAAYLQSAGIQGDGGIGLAHQLAEELHLGVGYHGKGGDQGAVFAGGAVFEEVQHEGVLCLDGVAHALGAAHEEEAGTHHSGDPTLTAVLGLFVQAALLGHVGL